MNKIIIIGGGIVGATAGYKLAKAGVDVTIIDRCDPGQATGAAAGIIGPWLAQRRNIAWYNLASNGARSYPALIEELTFDGETNPGYQKVGLLGLHTNVERLLKTKQRVLKRREDSPEIGNIKHLDHNDTKRFYPLVGENYQSIYVSGGARVDGRLLRNALINGAKKYGATIISGHARLLQENKKVTGVSIEKEIIKADKIILAAGAWINELLMPLGMQSNIYPQKAQIIHLKLPNIDTNEWPVVMPPNNQYILPMDNNKIVIGATHETKARFDQRVTAGGMHEILSKALDISPQLAQATFLEARVGFRPFTRGSLPVIGTLPGFENVLLANGLGASGLTIGPYVGTQLAKLAQDIQPSIDLTSYHVSHAFD